MSRDPVVTVEPARPTLDRPPTWSERHPRTVRALRAPNLLGTALAGYLLVQSWSPSLLVRDWIFQGVVGGVSLVVGYAAGTLLTRLGKLLRRRWGWGLGPFDERTDLRARGVVAVVLVVLLTRSASTEIAEHRWTWDRLGYEPDSLWVVYGKTIALTAVVAALFFLIGWAFRLLQRRLTRLGRRWLPAWIASSMAFAVLAWAVLASLNNYVMQRSLDGANTTFAAADLDTDGAPSQPDSLLRSGGPRSEVEWDEAGNEGRRFLSRGPDAATIDELSPGSAVEPVRVYVGRASADEVASRVELAMAELEHYGAFDRAAVLVVVPTGTGWINEQIVQPVEYFFGGDTATVAVQYSHLPSPLAFLAEADAAGDTGDALIGAVQARLDTIPEGDRPVLLVAGESLGSFGGAHAFDTLDDLLASTDGSLWVGPPETMQLRREAERVRSPGSPQIEPVVGDGEDVVFANRASDLAGTSPRTVFLQQGDDPIVWWDWGTAFSEPDWLKEPLDPSVNPDMTWTPVTTFLNLAFDMGVSNDFDEEHGHLYGTQPLTAWRAMLEPAAWDDERIEELRDRLSTVAR
ncbi:alpha/beta-hydrolase family protein [Aeromicrobium sp.]|uniref:alpha/beta-hydrolase family protein n=1 Tax=Aeromicrobium sp. TaxID=1871063 RepID=UPI003D6A2372